MHKVGITEESRDHRVPLGALPEDKKSGKPTVSSCLLAHLKFYRGAW